MYRYKYRKPVKSKLKSVEKIEGEPIEHKIERILSNKEPITDGAPEVFQERSEGINSAYNIRTDRWEVACEGMDVVQKSMLAQRDNKAKTGDSEKAGKIVDINKDSGAKSVDGTGTE